MALLRLKLEAGAEGWCEWVQPATPEHEGAAHRMTCCDCGLVHEVEIRVYEGRVQWRMRRHNRATAAVRAHDRKRKARPA